MRLTISSIAVAAGLLLTGALSCGTSDDEDGRLTSEVSDALLSQGKRATASSSGGCCAPSNVNDGSTSTRWASGANIDPSWIFIDLGGTFNVHRVQLTWDLSCAIAYEVQISPDHNAWTTLHSETAGNGGVDNITGLNATGRFVRMFGTKRCRSDASHGYSLQEFQVFGVGGDTEAPSAPGLPKLVSATSSSITVSWPAATDNIAVTGYDVFHDGQLCASVGGNTTTGTCDHLRPNTPFGFFVNAKDAAGNNSQPSPTLQVSTLPSDDHTAPTAPKNVHTTSVTSTSIALAWTASTDDVGVNSYTVYDVAANPRKKIGASSGNSAKATLDGLRPGTTFQLAVTATDDNRNESDQSPTLTVTTPTGTCTQPVCAATEVGTDDDVVWGLVTLPDHTLLYCQRDVHAIVHLDPKTGHKKTIGTVPNVQSTDGEGGLMGLEINPDSFASDHWLYIMHTSPSDNRIVRIKYDPAGDRLTSTEEILVTGIHRNKFHNGGRLRFSPDGKHLFASTGDGQNGPNAQNRNSLNGKILRINPDGSIPSDNPFGNAVWSFGHRNPQGLAFDSQGRLWEQEFGNSKLDETNLITKGGNYGWPDCEGTIGTCNTPGFIAPKRTYPVADGSCSGITIVRDALYVACERGTRLVRGVISGNNLTNVQTFFNGKFGRLRTVEPAPDGGMWMATSNGGDKDSTPHNSDNQIFHVDLGP
jgi:glucose/arabinose dehydrogenase